MAVEDKATVPLYYDARGDKLGVAISDLNERIAEKLEEMETGNIDVAQRLQQELKRDYHIITAEKRLDQVGREDVYPKRWESAKGTSGYSPACGNEWVPGVCHKPRVNCGNGNQRQLQPVSDQVIYDHLAGSLAFRRHWRSPALAMALMPRSFCRAGSGPRGPAARAR